MKKILIVDNDRILLHFLEKKLSKRGYHVVTAEDGLAALDILETYTPNVIFVDLIMPNIDGLKLCKIIRGMPQLKDVLLVILSAISAENDIGVAALGADVYIAKGPLDEMSQNIFAVLEQTEQTALRTLSEKVVGITAVSPRKITKELLSAKRHTEIILDKIAEGVLEITSGGRIIYANSTALALIGIPENNVLGSRFVELLAEDDRNGIAEILNVTDDESQEITYDSTVRMNEYQVTLTILPVNGNVSTHIIILNNISEKMRAEEALRDGEERYQAVLEASPDPVVVYNMTGKARYVNPAFTKVFGWQPEELLGKRIDYVPKENLSETLMMIDKLMAGESFSGAESRRFTKRGHVIDVSISSAIYRDRKGIPQGCVVYLRDITEQKRLQLRLQHVRKMESIGTIASGVAHNFKNILTGISVHNQLMQMKCQDNSELLKFFDRANNYVKWGSQLVSELMQFSHRKTSKFRPLNLNEVVQETYRVIRQTFDKNIHIHMNIPERLPVMGNHSGLSQVIMNLCNNAGDAMPDGGELRIEAEKEGGKIRLIISDTGCGMEEDVRVNCFDPFFTTKEVGEGTGLGLSTTYGIVKDHGGEIQVDSTLNQGTIFEILLPMTLTCGEGKKMNGSEIVQGCGQKILIVNNEKEILKSMEEFLEEIGYRVTSASSGKEAIVTYKSWEPDAVFLETNMPEMDGIACARKIVGNDLNARIILISGSEEYTTNGIDDKTKAQIKGFLVKPFELAELSILLARLFEASFSPAMSSEVKY